MEVPHGKIWVPTHAHPSIAGDPLLPVPTSRASSMPWDKLRDTWVQSPRCSCLRGNAVRGAEPGRRTPAASGTRRAPRKHAESRRPRYYRSSAPRSPAPPSRPAGRRAGGRAPAEGGFLRGSVTAGRGVGTAGCAGGRRGCGVGAGVGAFFWGGGRAGWGGENGDCRLRLFLSGSQGSRIAAAAAAAAAAARREPRGGGMWGFGGGRIFGIFSAPVLVAVVCCAQR